MVLYTYQSQNDLNMKCVMFFILQGYISYKIIVKKSENINAYFEGLKVPAKFQKRIFFQVKSDLNAS